MLRNFAVYPELVGLGQVQATSSTYLLWVGVSVPILLSKALHHYPDLPTRVLPTASLGPGGGVHPGSGLKLLNVLFGVRSS